MEGAWLLVVVATLVCAAVGYVARRRSGRRHRGSTRLGAVKGYTAQTMQGLIDAGKSLIAVGSDADLRRALGTAADALTDAGAPFGSPAFAPLAAKMREMSNQALCYSDEEARETALQIAKLIAKALGPISDVLQLSSQQEPEPREDRPPADAALDYFKTDVSAGDGLCSDDNCTCPQVVIPRGTGYLLITQELVEFRRRHRREEDAVRAKRANFEQQLASDPVLADLAKQGAVFGGGFRIGPILVCEQGARLRSLDLEVAAADAKHWWRTGQVPLRPTPVAVRRPSTAVRILIGYSGANPPTDAEFKAILQAAWDGGFEEGNKISAYPVSDKGWSTDEDLAIAWTALQQTLVRRNGEHPYWTDHGTKASKGQVPQTGMKFYVEVYFKNG